MELTLNRLVYLLYLNRSGEENCTVTKMAKLFQVSKSTVSRNMDYFVNQGIVYADTMRLTKYGEKLAAKYAEEVELFESWISWTASVEEQENRENAMRMTVYLSEDAKKQILQKVRLNKMFQHLNHRGSITFSEFVHNLDTGSYKVPFMIYRQEMRSGRFYSMANRGFAHPAILKISGNTGLLQLKAVLMERRNLMDSIIMSGKLMNLEYDRKGEFVPAEKVGDIYQIPADAMEFTFHKDENLLIGNLLLQIYAPMGKMKMHTKRAVLSIILKAL